MSSVPSSGNMDYMLYSLKASLQKFKGERGFQRLLDTGRLTLLSFLGEFEASQDEVFTKRSEAVMRTRQCLADLNELFDTVDNLSGSLVQTFSRIIQTLEEFHQCCDSELMKASVEGEMDRHDEFEVKFKELREQNAKLRQTYVEFSSLKLTPKRMNSSAMEQVEKSFLDASRIVGSSQTDLNVHRRRVQVRESDLQKAQMSGDQVAVQFAQNRVQEASRVLERVGTDHLNIVKIAMDKTKFSLEQTSMASWSSSNVFFSQLGSLFVGFGDSTRAIGNICCLIKNMQSVSKRISEEKGQALAKAPGHNVHHSDPQQLPDEDILVSPLPSNRSNNSNGNNGVLDDLFK